MKKLLTLAALSLLININAQHSFHKGALVVDANAGIEIFNTVLKVKNKNTGQSLSQDDKAGNSNFNIGVEYGVHKLFGAGIRLKSNNYFVEKDTITGTRDEVKSTDIVAQLNFHAVSTKKFDLILGTNIGYSKIKWTLKDVQNTKIYASGMYYDFYINPRLYFGRFGINTRIYFPFLNYPSLKSDNKDFTKDYTYNLKGSPGFGWSFGFQYRFMDEK